MRKAVDKIDWTGTVLGIQPRIRLTRSYDERMHSYLGYMLRLEGSVSSDEAKFSVGLGR